ncbi:Protein F43D2.6 [Aphelenchoides avenae]|nr:Protein F43D2.6 [Aphelenchus avenae]
MRARLATLAAVLCVAGGLISLVDATVICELPLGDRITCETKCCETLERGPNGLFLKKHYCCSEEESNIFVNHVNPPRAERQYSTYNSNSNGQHFKIDYTWLIFGLLISLIISIILTIICCFLWNSFAGGRRSYDRGHRRSAVDDDGGWEMDGCCCGIPLGRGYEPPRERHYREYDRRHPADYPRGGYDGDRRVETKHEYRSRY